MSAGSYGGFYTRQEQEDVLTSRIDNPNRVGSGFINLGPQERNVTVAANWQTASLLGGAPAPTHVSDIWASSTPAPVPPPQQQRLTNPPPPPQPQIQPFAAAPPQPFAPPPAPRDVNAIFSSLNLDGASPPQPMAQPPKPPTPYLGAGAPGASAYAPNNNLGVGNPNLTAGAPPTLQTLQSPFMNGGVAPQAAAAPQQSLMSLLQQQQAAAAAAAAPTVSAPSLAPVYGGLGNGTMANAALAGNPAATNRMQAAFANAVPPAPQCQLPPNGCAHAAAFASSAFAPSASRQAPPPPRPGPPKSLSSAADYAVAAQTYKPPPSTTTTAVRPVAPVPSLGRKPELSKPTPPTSTVVEKEWECQRCTFINNGSLWECEMCGFERPGKAAELQANASAVRGPPVQVDDGWKEAGKGGSATKAAPLPGAAAAAGKSKAQSKNEKRRAKKRGD